ncbi:MAG: UbiA prenyltransferase family protein [Phycisphaerales bacterium]
MPPLLRLMRPGDWTKNVFVLPAFVFSLPGMLGSVGDPAAEATTAAIRTAVAFLCFCSIASGFYCLNDVMDAEKDRTHPVKRKRPVASGAVRPNAAVLLGLILIGTSIGVGLAVRVELGGVLAAYGVLQLLYNGGLKRVLFVDVVALAVGFALRAVAGGVAIGVPISAWLLLCVFFLCLYLGFIKRLCDLTSAAAAGDSTWTSPAGYDDRIELNWLLGVSGVMAIVTFLMYALSDHAWELFGSRSTGFAMLTPLVMTAIHRFYRRASRGKSDSPLSALREDRTVRASVLLFAGLTVVILFVPQVQSLLDVIFVAGMPERGGG